MLTDMYEYLGFAAPLYVRQLVFLLCSRGILMNIQFSNYFLLLFLYFVVYVLFLTLSFLVTFMYSFFLLPFIPPLFHCLSLSFPPPPPPFPWICKSSVPLQQRSCFFCVCRNSKHLFDVVFL